MRGVYTRIIYNIKFGQRPIISPKFYYPVHVSRRHLGKTDERARCNKLMGHLYTWLTISTDLYIITVCVHSAPR